MSCNTTVCKTNRKPQKNPTTGQQMGVSLSGSIFQQRLGVIALEGGGGVHEKWQSH